MQADRGKTRGKERGEKGEGWQRLKLSRTQPRRQRLRGLIQSQHLMHCTGVGQRCISVRSHGCVSPPNSGGLIKDVALGKTKR